MKKNVSLFIYAFYFLSRNLGVLKLDLLQNVQEEMIENELISFHKSILIIRAKMATFQFALEVMGAFVHAYNFHLDHMDLLKHS